MSFSVRWEYILLWLLAICPEWIISDWYLFWREKSRQWPVRSFPPRLHFHTPISNSFTHQNFDYLNINTNSIRNICRTSPAMVAEYFHDAIDDCRPCPMLLELAGNFDWVWRQRQYDYSIVADIGCCDVTLANVMSACLTVLHQHQSAVDKWCFVNC